MTDDTLRQTLGLSAIAGGAVFGLYSLATRLWAGQPVSRQDVILALLNVGAAIVTGFLMAWFVGPALAPLVPIESLRDPNALGFGIGAGAWEAVPLALRSLRRFVAAKTGEDGQ